MIKKLLPVFIFLFSLQSSSQEDILGEWFLHYVVDLDVIITNNSPYRNIVFTDEGDYYNYEGNAVCNTYFSSTTAIDGNTFTAFPPTWTLAECHEHEEYPLEKTLFNLFQYNYDGVNPIVFDYVITGTGNEQTLQIYNTVYIPEEDTEEGYLAVYGRQPLPNEDLLGNWYLHSISIDSVEQANIYNPNSNIIFTLDSGLILDYSLNGNAICNSFWSDYNFSSPSQLQTDNNGITLVICDPSEAMEYENNYLFNVLFDNINNGSLIDYSITGSGNEAVLTINNPNTGNYAIYRRQVLSTHEFEDLSNIKLFPNPAIRSLTIDLNNSLTNEVNYSILSIDGKGIESNRLNNKTINISKLTAGLYFIKLSTENQTTTLKFIKK